MQVVEITQKAIDLTHPRDVFFALFPQDVTCKHCNSKMILDSPDDIVYHYSNDVIVHAWLTWTCQACTWSNIYTHDDSQQGRMLIEGYRQYFPKKAFWIENGAIVIMLAFFAVVFIFVGFATTMS